MTKRVFVALSGGVDSSVATVLLKERGFDVVGIHMKMWAPLEARAGGAAAPTSRRGLPLTGWAPQDSYQLPTTSYQRDPVCRQQFQDRIDAMRVAAKLDIPFQTWDFSKEYRKAVVDYMVREYAAGRTPNPDVMCNREIKFGLFLQRALAAGAEYIATGHYVRLRNGKRQKAKGKGLVLAQARDLNKDQSYFLWTLTQEQLQYCLFPIGEYTKPEVRKMARKFSLPTAEKPDSQGICFIGEIDISEFLASYIPERRGRVFTTAGKMVGEHNGAEFYTIGQRQGLGIGGGIPYYVAEKDTTTNTLVVAEGPYDEKLFQNELVAADTNWISGQEPRFPPECEARIRYRQSLQSCRVYQFNEFNESPPGTQQLRVIFGEPQRAVTPGQSIVFYRNGELLGGAVITD